MLSKKKNKKIFIIAGEISGDNIAYSILRDIKKKNNIEVHGIGGEALNKIGVKSIFSIQRIAVMGLIEILPKIPSLILLIRKTVEELINCLTHKKLPIFLEIIFMFLSSLIILEFIIKVNSSYFI